MQEQKRLISERKKNIQQDIAIKRQQYENEFQISGQTVFSIKKNKNKCIHVVCIMILLIEKFLS